MEIGGRESGVRERNQVGLQGSIADSWRKVQGCILKRRMNQAAGREQIGHKWREVN